MKRKKVVLILIPVLLGLAVVIQRTDLSINWHHNCSTRAVFSQRRLPVTALASYPGAGNTWFRHLLHKMTGIATGSVHKDWALIQRGFIGERIKNGSVVAIKTHFPNRNNKYDRVILLIRNPYEAMLADFNRRYSAKGINSHTGKTDHTAYLTYWKPFMNRTNGYKNFYLTWLDHKNVLPIFYDNMKKDLAKELSKTLAFLNVPGDVWCAVKDSEGVAHRDHSNDPPLRSWYDEKKIKEINDIILMIQEKFSARFKTETFSMRKWLL